MKGLALSLLILTASTQVAEAANFLACVKDLAKIGVTDFSRILDVPIPKALRSRDSGAVTKTEDKDLSRIARFYKGFSLISGPVAFAAIVGYFAKEFPGVELMAEGQYSSTVLSLAMMQLAYTQAASRYATIRNRLLFQTALIAATLHIFWEVGPLSTGFERLVPQVPRTGTDWADLKAGLLSSAVFPAYMLFAESIYLKLSSFKNSRKGTNPRPIDENDSINP